MFVQAACTSDSACNVKTLNPLGFAAYRAWLSGLGGPKLQESNGQATFGTTWRNPMSVDSNGAELTFEQVLLVENDGGEVIAGAPFVANARILAIVDGETRGPKIRVFKKKRRKGMRRTKGHRATSTRVRIKDILL